jgi:hypothetical protein
MSINKLTFYMVLFLNKTISVVSHSCRMYQEKPKETADKCSLCVKRGGWVRCRRSRLLTTEVAKENFV